MIIPALNTDDYHCPDCGAAVAMFKAVSYETTIVANTYIQILLVFACNRERRVRLVADQRLPQLTGPLSSETMSCVKSQLAQAKGAA